MARVALCATGSVAAYRVPDLARALISDGHEVRIVASRSTLRFVGEDALSFSSNADPPVLKLTGKAEHVEVSEWCDVVLMAPATLNSIAKVVHGTCDTPPTLTFVAALGAGKRCLVAPAMSGSMYRSPPCREALNKLRRWNVEVVEPVLEDGKAKLAPLDSIVAAVRTGLEGKRVVVTGGPTQEPIDDVRVITNPSSGLTAAEICRELKARGAEITLVKGPVDIDAPADEIVEVVTTEEMLNAVKRVIEGSDCLIMCAAPSDFKPKRRAPGKVPSDSEITVELEPTPKIVKEVFPRFEGLKVAFKTDPNPVEGARKLADRVPVDLIVANPPEVMGSEKGRWWILNGNGEVLRTVEGGKRTLAVELCDLIEGRLGG